MQGAAAIAQVPVRIPRAKERDQGAVDRWGLNHRDQLGNALSGPVATPAGHFWIESLYGSERMRTDRECFASRHSPDAAPPALEFVV